MSWRICNLARKKQIEGEESRHLEKKRMERKRARMEATADMSEDLSEVEKGDTVAELSPHVNGHKETLKRVNSVDLMSNWEKHSKDKKLYIVLIRVVMFALSLVIVKVVTWQKQ